MSKIINIEEHRPPMTDDERRRMLQGQIAPIIEHMMQMDPRDAADFCRAVCIAVDHITDNKLYRYFASSVDLAYLIDYMYVVKTKGFEPKHPAERAKSSR